MSFSLKMGSFNLKQAIFYTLNVSLVAGFPVIFTYAQNAFEVAVSEFILLFLQFIIMGIVVYAVNILVLRSLDRAAFSAFLWLMVLLNFGLLEKGLKLFSFQIKYWHILFWLIIILGHAMWLIKHIISIETIQTLNKIILLVFCALSVFNLFFAVPNIIKKNQVANSKSAVTQDGSANTALPNFYYFIFDEYGGPFGMKDYYGHDTTQEKEFFEKKGFSYSLESYAWTRSTKVETLNLFELDYVADISTPLEELTSQLPKSAFFNLLNERGYALNGVGRSAVYQYGLPAAYAVAESEAATLNGKNFLEIVVDNTIFYPFLNRGDIFNFQRDSRLDEFEFLADPQNYKIGGQFYLLHTNIPHAPFLFTENGDPLDSRFSANWTNKQYYLGQYKYASKWMQKIAETILTIDPNSIIVFQSDHGFRGGDGIMTQELTDKQMLNIINAVYYKGEEINVQGLSSVNTLRLICNRLFGTDFGLLEDRGRNKVEGIS